MAKLLEGDSDLTRTAAVLGTPSYMSPEQAPGQTKQLTTASDVFSLGAILYELLTGRPPFRGATAVETMRQVLEQEPKRPKSLNPGIDPDLETICLKCLQKEPKTRYSSADALAEDLERWQNGELIQARPSTLSERAIKWARRKPAMAALAGVSCVALLAFVGLAVGLRYNARLQVAYQKANEAQKSESISRKAEEQQRRRAEDALKDAEKSRAAEAQQRRVAEEALANAKAAQRVETEARKREEEQRERAEKALLDAQKANYLRNVAFAERDWLANNVAQVEQLLDDCPAHLREFEWYHLKRLCHSDLFTLHGHLTNILPITFCDSGKTLATISRDGAVKVWGAGTGLEIRSFDVRVQEITSAAFNPDGAWLAVGRKDGKVELWEVSAGRYWITYGAGGGWVTAVALSSDAKRMAAVTSGNNVVSVWDTETDELFRTFKGHTELVNCLAFSPDGNQLASGSGELAKVSNDSRGFLIPERPGVLKVWDVTSERVTSLGGATVFLSVAFAPDGKRLVSGHSDHSLIIWSIKSGEPVHILKGHSDNVHGVIFSQDGRHIVSCSDDQTAKIWDAIDGKEEIAHRGHAGGVRVLTLSPDGKRLATGCEDFSVKVWDLMRKPGTVIIRGGAGGLAFSPDGKRLTSGSSVWSALDGTLLDGTPPTRGKGGLRSVSTENSLPMACVFVMPRTSMSSEPLNQD